MSERIKADQPIRCEYVWTDAVKLTWAGHSVPVLGHVVLQGLQHHPHGEGEEARQEGIEHQVEADD